MEDIIDPTRKNVLMAVRDLIIDRVPITERDQWFEYRVTVKMAHGGVLACAEQLVPVTEKRK
jgi:hypothetical protein